MRNALKPSLGPYATEVAAFFQRRGFVLHACCAVTGDGQDHAPGGVCVTEEPGGSVLVGWSAHPTLAHRDGVGERAEVVVAMVSLFRGFLEGAHYPVEEGPLGRSVRVLSPVAADTVPEQWVSA